ncbi:MAG: class I SAM-dependent methyltransferase [Acidobacteria bacterium]|nr:class I SAM-dependent methyltransferase [Acidobacteriota bacterium]
MLVPRPSVKPHLEPAIATGPKTYEQWRGTTLGHITDILEQQCIVDLMGPVQGRCALDLGCGDGVLTATLAERGARAIGVDADRTMLDVAIARRGRGDRPQYVEGRIETLPFPDSRFDVVVVVTVLCLVTDRTAAIREAARVLRPGGRLVIGELGRWSVWAARRRVRAWLGSTLWRSARFTTATELSRLVERAGLTVEAVRGAVYYPPIFMLARLLAPLDRWLGSRTTAGAAFIAVAAVKEHTNDDR